MREKEKGFLEQGIRSKDFLSKEQSVFAPEILAPCFLK
jgi:hypothetical protein